MRTFQRFFGSSLGLLALTACSPAALRGGGYCSPPAVPQLSFASDPEPPPGASRSARVAALLGLASTVATTPLPVDARVRIVERVELARLAIASTSAELDCESERAEQAADFLTRSQTKNVQLLTIGSVAVAALTGIAGVFLSTHQAPAGDQEALAIGGGVATAVLGLASLYIHPRTDFAHARNLLADVWSGPAASSTYPPIVWAYLTHAEFSNSQQEPIRQKIVGRWRRFEQVDDPASAALLFGTGGRYDADTLRTRAEMLDEVQAEVELTEQDLMAFAGTIVPP